LVPGIHNQLDFFGAVCDHQRKNAFSA